MYITISNSLRLLDTSATICGDDHDEKLAVGSLTRKKYIAVDTSWMKRDNRTVEKSEIITNDWYLVSYSRPTKRYLSY
jgi:hypothetical protein